AHPPRAARRIRAFPDRGPAGSPMDAARPRRILDEPVLETGGTVMEPTNLAGRAGRWSAAHWKSAAFGWLAFAVLAVVVGNIVGPREMKDWQVANGESRRAAQILDSA